MEGNPLWEGNPFPDSLHYHPCEARIPCGRGILSPILFNTIPCEEGIPLWEGNPFPDSFQHHPFEERIPYGRKSPVGGESLPRFFAELSPVAEAFLLQFSQRDKM